MTHERWVICDWCEKRESFLDARGAPWCHVDISQGVHYGTMLSVDFCCPEHAREFMRQWLEAEPEALPES